MSSTSPRLEYAARIARWSDEVARGERRHLLISNSRLAAVAVFVLTGWLAFSQAVISPGWMVVPLLGFAGFVVSHARVLHRNERAVRARRLYERGFDRLEGRWSGAGTDGARFLEGHPYARDLDLFGAGSLFQLLNAGKTEAGEETLAEWLKQPAAVDEVHARQAAVVELAPEVSFRETLAVVAAEAHVGRTSALNTWASLPPFGLPRRLAWLFLLCGLTTVVVIVTTLTFEVPVSLALVWFLVQGAIVLRWRQQTDEVIHRIDAASDDLALFRELLETVEAARFSAPWLVSLRERLIDGGELPSKQIGWLQGLVSTLNQYQHNPYFRFFGTPLLVGSQVAVAIDRWHAAHGRALARWLTAVGEIEAISSLATYAYENPAAPFPSLLDAGAVFEADELAHPLLPIATAVRNDLRIGGTEPHVFLVSGSNMSGKSTLLRAVGLNVVLALAGAPVRADRMKLSRMAIGATLRVNDSLQEGYSRFYSEILRIRSIVALAQGRTPALFLLDEILHGTNSYDRRIGAEAIVRALVSAGAVGLVTTHDLALTELVASLGQLAANVHFEDQIVGDRMVFDYRLRPGVVERSNALALMRAVGIDV